MSIVFSFSWGHFNSHEKLKTMLMQNCGVTNKEYYGMLWYFLEWSIQLVLQQCCITSCTFFRVARFSVLNENWIRNVSFLPEDAPLSYWPTFLPGDAPLSYWPTFSLETRRSAIGQTFSLSLVTIPEVFAKVNSPQFPMRF